MKYNPSITYILLLLVFHLTSSMQLHAYGYNRTAQEYNIEMKRLFTTSKMDSIKIVLDEALALYPNDANLNRWAATYFLKKKEPQNARYFLIKAVKQDEENDLAKQQLIALEESLGNLSSAICYINELLELYPYDQALWKKKIGLYRKQGNDPEADRLIKRLYTIYPNDSIVRNDYLNRLEEIYAQQKKAGKNNEAITTLKDLIGYRNNEKSYYLDLGNLLLQEGHSEEAVAIITKGLQYFPKDTDLLRKKAEIMAERGYNKEAIGLLQNSTLYPLAEELMIEAARKESWKDPYILYGKIYDAKKSDEALDYLIRTSISREYNDDALYYLSEYRKKHGTSPEVLYKEYRIFKRTGNIKSALKALEKYVSLNKSDEDMLNELAMIKINIADDFIKVSDFYEAIPYLESAQKLSKDIEIISSARNKLLQCYLSSKKYEQALSFIDSIRAAEELPFKYTEEKAEVLHQTGRSMDAITEMENADQTNTDTYERISSEYVKRLILEGAVKQAYETCKTWIKNVPQSLYGLMHAINVCETLELYDEADKYIRQGKDLYPDNPFFVLKEAAALYRNKKYQSGMNLLETWVDSLSGNKEIISAYSAHVEMIAQEYLKQKDPDKALSIIKNIKKTDNNNQELLLLEGKAYEMKGDYQAAYRAYSKYKPESLWIKEYKRKLMAVQNKGYRNTIMAESLNGWYSDGNRPNTLLTTSYSRRMKKDDITSTINLSYKNSSSNGNTETLDSTSVLNNTGVQLRIDWKHTYNKRWSSSLGAAVSNSIFPTWLGQAGIFYTFRKDIETGITIGYRKNYSPVNLILNKTVNSTDIYNIRLSGNIYKETWRINTNYDTFIINNSVYFNLNSQFKYYPSYDGNTHIIFSAAAGTAPEIDFVDKLMPGSFENLNATFGLGGVYMVSKNISLGLTISYHYFYNDIEKSTNENVNNETITYYKNLYDIYAHIIFSF